MYELNKQAFGVFLMQLRKEKGYTQKELAEKLYVSDKAVSKWERGLSVPDVSLLVPLAELLDISVTELLEGHRLNHAALAPNEVETIVQKAITYPEERESAAKRIGLRVRENLPRFALCTVLGLVLSVLAWRLVNDEGTKIFLIVSELLGILHGFYAMFFMEERLPHYYDENRINMISQYGLRINIPGVYFNNNNWKGVLRVLRIWTMTSIVAVPIGCAVLGWCSVQTGAENQWILLLLGYLASLFLPIVYAAKKYE